MQSVLHPYAAYTSNGHAIKPVTLGLCKSRVLLNRMFIEWTFSYSEMNLTPQIMSCVVDWSGLVPLCLLCFFLSLFFFTLKIHLYILKDVVCTWGVQRDGFRDVSATVKLTSALSPHTATASCTASAPETCIICLYKLFAMFQTQFQNTQIFFSLYVKY